MAAAVAAALGYLAGTGGNAARTRPSASGVAKRPGTGAAHAPVASGVPLRFIALPRAASSAGGARPVVATVPATIGAGLATSEIGVPYVGFLWGTGGTAPYTWSVTGGSLPAGLTLDGATGVITGTPTAAGTSHFTISEADSGNPVQTVSAAESITIINTPALSVASTALPSPTVGQQYSATLSAAGGIAPFTWSVTSGTLPQGLSLDPATGIISGTPSAAGSSTFTVQAKDSATQGSPATATAQLSITVTAASAPLALAPAHLPSATQGAVYTAALASTGGTAPMYWSLASGSLPDG